MKNKISKEDIIKIISKILKISPKEIEKIDNYEKMDSWDSLAQLDIISAIDKKLNGKIGKVKNIAEIMAGSDLCIGAAGSTSWERCFLGLPTIALCTAKNQIGILSALRDYGVVEVSSVENIKEDFEKFFSKGGVEKLTSLSDRSKKLFDLPGTHRVLQVMESIHANCNN